MSGQPLKAKTAMKYNHAYWNNPANLNNKYYLCKALSDYKEQKYIELIARLKNQGKGKCLITDLYEGYFGITGTFEYLSKRFDRLIGMDISKEVLLKTRQEMSPGGISFCVADVRDLPFPDNTIDVVVSRSTLDHFPEIDKAVSEIYRVLKTDGIFLLSLNNRHNLFFAFNLRFLSLINFLTFHTEDCYSLKKTRKLVKGHHFTIAAETTLMHVPFLFPTILSFLERRRLNILLGLFLGAVSCMERISKRFKVIGIILGWWIVIIANKKPIPDALSGHN